jgi:uncharacterized membrane protein
MTSTREPNMANWDRAISLGVGAALIALAWKRRHLSGSAMTAGVGFLVRGATGNCPAYAVAGYRTRPEGPRRHLSGSAGIHIKETITIRADAGDLFHVWDNVENFPVFMNDVERVERLDAKTSRWTVSGPAGYVLTWDAEIINRIDGQLIAWKSLPGADVVSAGSVRFEPLRRGGTAVTVHLQYDPPLGKAGATAAWFLGRNLRATLRQDLRRLKKLMEASERSGKAAEKTAALRFNLADRVIA